MSSKMFMLQQIQLFWKFDIQFKFWQQQDSVVDSDNSNINNIMYATMKRDNN